MGWYSFWKGSCGVERRLLKEDEDSHPGKTEYPGTSEEEGYCLERP